jgi:predicted transcriptional regulator
MKVLHVKVAEPVANILERARSTMERLDAGGPTPEPYFGIGFESVSQMLAVLTPKRLELVSWLSTQGPLSVAALARGLGRDCNDVHGDVAALEEWSILAREEDGRISVPWDEIDLHLPLTRQAA